MIALRRLTKRYGSKVAVNELDLEIEEGKVTGFLGPNGSGKSTTMRMIVGLDHPTMGEALISGRRYVDLTHPLRKVGALLDASAVHPGRSARNHLKAAARSNGIPIARVDEVLETVGLTQVADTRVGAFSLGMAQRLGIAGALLGDPKVLILDEPINGLDPDGVRWARGLIRSLAAEGRTVFVSSHLMSEMQITADRLVVIGQGQLIADAEIADLIAASARTSVSVRSPDADSLVGLVDRLTEEGAYVQWAGEQGLMVAGVSLERVGDLAFRAGVRLHELRRVEASLEQVYMELTGDSLEYGGGSVPSLTRDADDYAESAGVS